jgi:hypothetical protein
MTWPDTNFRERERNKYFLPVFKVPGQCPLALLVEVRLRDDKALESETGKPLGSGLCFK